jgi:hypothetical protein
MKNSSVFSYFRQVIGARRVSNMLMITHLYILLVAVLINSLLYLSITKPSFDSFYTSSVLQVPEIVSTVENTRETRMNESVHVDAYVDRLDLLEEQLSTLEKLENLVPEVRV